MAPERTSVSAISSACSPASGCDQELVDIDAELARIGRIERVLGIDEGAGAAGLLGLRDDMERQRGLARAFRPVDLHHPAARQAADAKRQVEADRAGRDGLGLGHRLALAQLHHRALAEGPLDLHERGVQRLVPVHAVLFDDAKLRGAHDSGPSLFHTARAIRNPNRPRCTHFVLV
jgi:hypothetical protein